MKQLIKRHNALSFCIIVLSLSGLLLLLHIAFPAAGDYSVSFPQFAPALGVLALCLLTGDFAPFAAILRRLKPGKAHLKGYACAVLLPVVLVVLSAVALSLLGVSYQPWGGGAAFYLLNLLFMLLGCFGEEIGWRGFLLPTLQKRLSPFASALLVGVFWGVWHLNFAGGVGGFVLYTLTVTELSILFTFLYNRTEGNVLAIVFCHFAFNLLSHLLLWERFGVTLYMVQAVLFGIACAAILIANRKEFFSKPPQTV